MSRAWAGKPLLHIFSCGLALLMAGPVLAIDLGQPEVTKGVTELRNVNVAAWDKDDDGSPRHLHEYHIGYGVTEELALKGILAVEGADGEHMHAVIGAVEGTYELIDIEKSGGFGLAWYTIVDLAIDDEASHDVLFGPILKFHTGKWDFVTNTYAVRTFGDNRTPGTEFTYAWLAAYEICPKLRIGVEGDGGIDAVFHLPPVHEQEHRIGPVLFTEFNVGKQVVTMDLGVQFGLTDPAADTEAKLIFGTVF
ncbi:MAG: transporter [Hyphomicrobiaceae bacterium]|nr:transporter [Hyphomicrobiaceae bacterium]